MATVRRKSADGVAVGKRIAFDPEILQALELLARDRTASLQELADEAFRDLLKKHKQPTDLRAQLRQSAKESSGRHGARSRARQ